MKKLKLLTLLVAGLLLVAPSAYADEIGLGGGTGSITFTSNGDGTLSFNTTAGFPVSSLLGTFQSPNGNAVDFGSASFGAMSGTTGTVSGNVFPITLGGTGTESFIFTGAADSLSGQITWPDIKDNTTSPQFDVDATLYVTSVNGTTLFTGDFPVGSYAQIDLTVSGSTTLESLAASPSGTSATFNFSAAEVTPAVPEPATLLLLGAGMTGLGLLRRRTKKA